MWGGGIHNRKKSEIHSGIDSERARKEDEVGKDRGFGEERETCNFK